MISFPNHTSFEFIILYALKAVIFYFKISAINLYISEIIHNVIKKKIGAKQPINKSGLFFVVDSVELPSIKDAIAFCDFWQ